MTQEQRVAVKNAAVLYGECLVEEHRAYANLGCMPLAEIGKRVMEARENTDKAWIKFVKVLDAISEPSE